MRARITSMISSQTMSRINVVKEQNNKLSNTKHNKILINRSTKTRKYNRMRIMMGRSLKLMRILIYMISGKLKLKNSKLSSSKLYSAHHKIQTQIKK